MILSDAAWPKCHDVLGCSQRRRGRPAFINSQTWSIARMCPWRTSASTWSPHSTASWMWASPRRPDGWLRGLTVLLFPLDGWDAVKAGVQPRRVVPVDPSEHGPAGFGPGGEDSALQAFAFQRFPERLGHGVVPANPRAADRGSQLTGVAELEVV